MSKPNKNRKKYYETYKQENRRLKNKETKREKHEKRMAKFAKRRKEGKAYSYKPNPFETGTEKYILEENNRRCKNNRPIDIGKWDSVMRKLKNRRDKELELAKARKEARKGSRKK